MRKKFSPDKTLAYSAGIGDLLNLCQDLNQTNVSNLDKNGRTVLHYAADYGIKLNENCCCGILALIFLLHYSGKPNIALMMVDIILNAFFIRNTTNPESESGNHGMSKNIFISTNIYSLHFYFLNKRFQICAVQIFQQ